MDCNVRAYLSAIGQKGGRASRRKLTSEVARAMVAVREARRAYRAFHSRCFWSYDPDYRVVADDIPWVIAQLRQHGGREAWDAAAKLCR